MRTFNIPGPSHYGSRPAHNPLNTKFGAYDTNTTLMLYFR
ncbi:unnamed protein product [marine sediment metagenome]|uniref:Uncharacterized protein n=1 Tax=marine sediment metagenome TaxID=412755 RepID=X1DKD0_9ZZZZ